MVVKIKKGILAGKCKALWRLKREVIGNRRKGIVVLPAPRQSNTLLAKRLSPARQRTSDWHCGIFFLNVKLTLHRMRKTSCYVDGF